MRSVDVFISEPIAFDQLLGSAIIKDLDGLPVPVASIAHLIEMKRLSGRPRDLEDIDKLQQIRDAEQTRADDQSS